jgi:hypothetical protein
MSRHSNKNALVEDNQRCSPGLISPNPAISLKNVAACRCISAFLSPIIKIELMFSGTGYYMVYRRQLTGKSHFISINKSAPMPLHKFKKVVSSFGFYFEQNGSHFKVKDKYDKTLITGAIAHKKSGKQEVKPIYIKKFLDLMDQDDEPQIN